MREASATSLLLFTGDVRRRHAVGEETSRNSPDFLSDACHLRLYEY